MTVSRRKPISVEAPQEASFGCSAGTGASLGWGVLLLAGLARRRGAKQR